MNRIHEPKRKRNGTVLFIVIVCLVAASTILLGAVGLSIRHRGQLRTELQLEQTYWLLDAGIGKAIEQSKQHPDFEDLEISTAETLDGYAGSISIVVVEREQETTRIRVTAKLERADSTGITTQRSRLILLKNIETNKDVTNIRTTQTEY